MRVLFLDLETTGLKPERSLVWQVAYAKAVQESDRVRVLEMVEIVGRECIQNRELKQVLEWADVLVAHNVYFEEEFLSHKGLPVPKESFCTMRRATSVCKIPNPYYVDDRGNIREWLSPYKRPNLSEAVQVLGLEDHLRAVCRNLTFHDALCDVYATIFLYAKLKNLELEFDGYRIRRANSLRKYLTVRQYAVVGKEELLRSIASQSLLVKVLEKVFNLSEKFRRLKDRWRSEEDLPF
ncbi:MAG: hypothetical protein RMK75_07900 [Aquificaceae bacterium]|nr:hypothetical protein [Aquificaceae bacterium]MDW8424223.1 hypothetical protein [Aquificaceae bacterium]